MTAVLLINDNSGTIITVNFPEVGEKQLGTFVSAANGIITADADGYADKIDFYRDILKKESSGKTGLLYLLRRVRPCIIHIWNQLGYIHQLKFCYRLFVCHVHLIKIKMPPARVA